MGYFSILKRALDKIPKKHFFPFITHLCWQFGVFSLVEVWGHLKQVVMKFTVFNLFQILLQYLVFLIVQRIFLVGRYLDLIFYSLAIIHYLSMTC